MYLLDGVEMVDVREAARLAGRTPETIRRWVWSGRLEARRRGNRLLLARIDVLRQVGSQPDPARATETLSQWAADVAVLNRGRQGGTASDLVVEDRRARDDASR